MDVTTHSPVLDRSEAEQRDVRLVLVCAWCGNPVRSRPRAGDEVENFGICPACLREQLSRIDAVLPQP